MANLLYLMDSEHATSWYRVKVPANELGKLGHAVVVDNKFNEQALRWCDIFIIQRTNQKEVHEAVKFVNSLGKLTVMDLDDNYWDMHYTNPAFQPWQTPGMLSEFTNIIREVKLLTTTVEPLAQLIRRYNSNVKITPNSLPDDYWNNIPAVPRFSNRVVVGWAGSTSHFYDMQEVINNVFPQILRKYPYAEIKVAGVAPDWFPPQERFTVLQPVKIEQYPSLLTNFDIGIAPLRDIKFNESKSNLKFLEYSAVKIPTVASKTITYTPYIQHGETGFLAKNSKDWLRHLGFLIENPDKRIEIGLNARKYMENKVISKVIQKWIKAYGLEGEQ